MASGNNPYHPALLHGLSGNDLGRRWLAGVNLRLYGLALGWGGSLLADERFLFHRHCGFSRFFEFELLCALP
jgi:hypothetical protein